MVNEKFFQLNKNVGDLPVWVDFKGMIWSYSIEPVSCTMLLLWKRKKNKNKKKEHLCGVPTLKKNLEVIQEKAKILFFNFLLSTILYNPIWLVSTNLLNIFTIL